MAIDLTTGLPFDDSGIIEQIPLGGQVFPFIDLDATARPKRNPIYGDDVIPTSALVVGRHPTLVQPQAIFTDAKNALKTREAVFQSNGAPIAAGATAPVDVNVVGGGGGGGLGTVVPVTITSARYYNAFTDFWWPPSGAFVNGIPYKYIYGFTFAHECDTYAIGGSTPCNLWITSPSDTTLKIPLAYFFMQPITGTTMTYAVNINIFFPYRIDVKTAIGASVWKIALNVPTTSASAGFYTLGVIVSD